MKQRVKTNMRRPARPDFDFNLLDFSQSYLISLIKPMRSELGG